MSTRRGHTLESPKRNGKTDIITISRVSSIVNMKIRWRCQPITRKLKEKWVGP